MSPARQIRFCVTCGRPIRPAGVKVADAPGTAQWGSKGECSRCAQHTRNSVRADGDVYVSPETLAAVTSLVARRAQDLAEMIGVMA